MITIEFLRSFRFLDYAVFDFIIAFLGIYLISPFLTKIFLKFRINIPQKNWLFLALPIGIIFHILFLSITPMTKDFLDLHNHYLLKFLIILLLFLGIRGIKLIDKKI